MPSHTAKSHVSFTAVIRLATTISCTRMLFTTSQDFFSFLSCHFTQCVCMYRVRCNIFGLTWHKFVVDPCSAAKKKKEEEKKKKKASTCGGYDSSGPQEAEEILLAV